jgi:PPOX class probable F420-dependent enzyme
MSQTAVPKNAHVEERLRSNVIAWFTTVRADGRPHSIPVWFLWDGSTVLVFSKPNNQKLRNIQHNPNVLLALDDTDEGGDIIVLEGKAELVDPQEINVTLSAYEQKYGSHIKDLGWTPANMAAEYSQPIRITPTRFVFG